MSTAVESPLHSYLPEVPFAGNTGPWGPKARPNRRQSEAGQTESRHAEPRHPDRELSFDELIAPHVGKILRTTYRITRNHGDAEDARQDCLLQALLHFQDFDGRAAFSTWLTRIAINSSLMILRKRKSARTVSLDGASDSDEPNLFQEVRDPAPDAEERYLQKERERTVRDATSALRPNLRIIVELAHFGERSMRETAEIAGVSVAAAKTRLFHAREALRKSRKLSRFRKTNAETQGISKAHSRAGSL